MKISPAGLDLIKEFEGLELTAYPDPGTGGDPWTIGYGHTGPDVYPGLVISIAFAEKLLEADLEKFEEAVAEIIPLKLSQPEFDALVSFVFNCGTGALASSTLRRRLLAGEPRCKVYQEEMPRWNKGGNGPMPGLTRRREAEAEMACSGVNNPEPASFLENAAKYYQELPHQKAAWRALEDILSPEVLSMFKNAYRASEEPVKAIPAGFPLDVSYFYQLDSKTGHGERSCFSSAMAMALDYVDPVKFDGMDDDDYLLTVFKYGDTVSSTAQMQAAESLGYQATFHTDGTEQKLLDLLDSGTPVPIGVLHKGPVSNPSGGGHWICLTGYDETHFWCGDPFGEMDVVNGSYVSNGPLAGDQVRYSRKNLMKRWLIDGSGADGWYMHVS